MSFLFWSFVSFIFKVVLSLRYRIEVRGMEAVRRAGEEGKGLLFMPNHVAHIDVMLLFVYFWPRFRMRPLATEYIFRMPFLSPWIRLTRALCLPDLYRSVNGVNIRRVEAAMRAVADGLKAGDAILFYPSGHLKNGGKEEIGGASGALGLLRECPEAKAVLIRTTGLWGSSFSRAFTGRSPDLVQTFLKGMWAALKSGLFFLPRRRVIIECEVEPPGLDRSLERLPFNRFLESWYNRYPVNGGEERVEVEPLQLVSYSAWRQVIPPVYSPKKRERREVEPRSETKDKVYREIRRILEKEELSLSPEMSLTVDLGMDSLNLADLIAFLAAEFEIKDLHPEDLDTVETVLAIAERGEPLNRRPEKAGGRFSWGDEKERPEPTLPLGETIPEAFLNACSRMKQAAALADDLVGVLSYRQAKRAVLVLSTYFRQVPGDKIAVLLPASVGAYLTILAIQCAGKVPVMLNWTLGPRYLDEMIRLSGASKVVSSWRFIDRLSHVEFGDAVLDRIELLEDIRAKLSIGQKLRGALWACCSPKTALRALGLHRISADDPAVILFTSGTEASPKGVPLSHRNLIANERSAMQCIDLEKGDCLYGILPPFHSFGFSVAGLFPLLIGIKVAFYPDPTDSFSLAEGIERWRATLVCAAPSFLRGLLQAATPSQLATIRYFITGAEKAPPALFDKVKALGGKGKILEGYGITECAPVLTITRVGVPPKGVGQLLPDVEMCTIHPETLEPLPPGKEGEVCVRGPNVFAGYLGNPRSPFITLFGKPWYRTGDIGYLDPDGNLILSGRLKRFTKIGGEMISLGAIEEALQLSLSSSDAAEPTLALCADERNPTKPQLILFSTRPLSKDEANAALTKAGFSRLVKISAVQQVEAIPLLGTGKTDYRRLQSMIV
jgi:long-chain-fatty-acid--[acyl-carrier-protein] ligase